MSKDFLSDRQKGLEESYFARQNETIRQQLREQAESKDRKEALAIVSGITDEALLDRLLALNIDSERLAAFSLLPLVITAWPDGDIDASERQAVLAEAYETGLSEQDSGYRLLEHWLSERPDPELFAAWKAYIAALAATQSDEARKVLKSEILSRARAIANASGGFLGLGCKISSQEKNILAELKRAIP